MINAVQSKFLFLGSILLLISFLSSAQTVRPIGTNLTGIQDWSSEYVFVDVFKQCREWFAHENGSGVPWSSTIDIPLGPNGYPLEIPYNDGVNPPQYIRTLMYFGNLNNHYPSGDYRLMASGIGQIRLWGAATGTYACPIDTFVSVNSSLGGIALEIEVSDVSDPVHAIHFVMPGFGNTFLANPFNPDLIQFLDDFQVIRFMDWMKTNHSENQFWTDRNTPDYYTQTLSNGTAYEYIINICNLSQTNPWICIPHRANDQYITELAKLFRDSLDTSLKVYVEYSNEVWNGQFAQSAYADSMGNVFGYTGNAWEQGWQFYAKRTADVLQIFETEFQGSSRLVKVIASQAANGWLCNYTIDRFEDPVYNPTQVQADALAIAPYFGGNVANIIGDAGLINSITVPDILDSMALALPVSFDWMDAAKTIADAHNLDLIAYEGGQHLVANWNYQNDTAYVNKLSNANRHALMEDLYCNYFMHWYDSTQAGLFCNFSSHGLYGKYGSWGVKEFMEDSLSPKYLGLKNCVFAYNVDTSFAAVNMHLNEQNYFNVFPIPCSNGRISLEHAFSNPTIYLIDNAGRSLSFSIDEQNETSLLLNVNTYSGFAILVLSDKDKTITKKVLFLE